MGDPEVIAEGRYTQGRRTIQGVMSKAVGCLPVERRWKPPIGRSFAGCNPFSLTIPRFRAPGLSAGLSFTPAPLTPGPLLGRGLGCQENAFHLPPCPSFSLPQGDLASYRKHHRRPYGAWRDERGHRKERVAGEGHPLGLCWKSWQERAP